MVLTVRSGRKLVRTSEQRKDYEKSYLEGHNIAYRTVRKLISSSCPLAYSSVPTSLVIKLFIIAADVLTRPLQFLNEARNFPIVKLFGSETNLVSPF